MGNDTGNMFNHTHNYNVLETTVEMQDKVEGAFLLNIVVRKSATVLELFASKDQTLLVRRNTLLIQDLRLHVETVTLEVESSHSFHHNEEKALSKK